jgi:hypothetical protein
LSIFNNLTNLLLHSSKEFSSLLFQLFQNWANTKIILLLNNIILNFIFSNFIILVWLFILCSQGWSSMILDLTSFFFGSLNCLRHLLNNSVLYFTCLILCCFLWGRRSQVEGVRLKFEGLKSQVTVSSLKFDSLVTLLVLRSLCQVKGLMKLEVWSLSV